MHFESIDTEAVGDRCIDVERFSGDTLLLVSGHRAECLHVVQTVGKLDEDDANVFDHREHHFPKAFGLSLCLTAKLNLIQLADTIDEQRDFATELLRDVVERCSSVLNRIVQNSSGYRLGIEPHFGELLCYSDRVSDICLARLTRLSGMRLRTKFISGCYGLELVF